MSELRQMVVTVIRQRKYLVKKRLSGRNEMLIYRSLKKIETMLQAYPNMTESQLANYLRRHWEELSIIIPGSEPGKSIKQKIASILWTRTNGFTSAGQ